VKTPEEQNSPEQKGMDFSRAVSDMSMLEHAELEILKSFCANPKRYEEMEKKVQILTQDNLLNLVMGEFNLEVDKAKDVVLGHKKSNEKDTATIAKLKERAKAKAHIDATNKNINKAKKIAKAWWETLNE
jgi:hypothetical protein